METQERHSVQDLQVAADCSRPRLGLVEAEEPREDGPMRRYAQVSLKLERDAFQLGSKKREFPEIRRKATENIDMFLRFPTVTKVYIRNISS